MPATRVSGSTPGRRIVGNLDCETYLAALSGRPSGPLPRKLLTHLAGLATLLRAFALDDDRLWLPAPIDPEVMAEVPGLPRPILETGPLENLEPTTQTLAWGNTPATAGLAHTPSKNDDPLPQNLPWQLPLPSPEVTATVNDRRFGLELSDTLGCRLPGARTLASMAELQAHLQTYGHEPWVLKAPFSAAGRWRLIHIGPLDALARRRAERLFARHGDLVFEPWMERTLDTGIAAALTTSGLRRISLHRQLVDRVGRFRGIELIAGARGLEGPWLKPQELQEAKRVLAGTTRALERAGYSGPFSIDSWRYQATDGETFQPLGEINARLTFGWVARALVDRVREPLGIRPDQQVRLIFGRPDAPISARVVPLLHALNPGAPEASLEIAEL